MAWSKAFYKKSNEECAKFLCQYMQNVPKDQSTPNPYKDVLKYIVGGIMVSPCFRLASQDAQTIIVGDGLVLQDLNPTINPDGKVFRIEHTIPISCVTDYLLGLPESDINEANLLSIIKAVRGVALITQDEDRLLQEDNLNSKLPNGCTIGDLLGDSPQSRYSCRYEKAGIRFEEYWSPETGIK